MERIRTQRFTLDPDTYLRAMWGRDLWRSVAMLWVIATAASLVVVPLVRSGEQLKTFLWAVLGDAAIVGLLMGARFCIARWKMNSPEVQGSFEDPHVVEFGENALAFESESGIRSSIPWEKLGKVERRPPYLLFLIGRNQCLAVPTASFETEADLQALEQFLCQRGLLEEKSG